MLTENWGKPCAFLFCRILCVKILGIWQNDGLHFHFYCFNYNINFGWVSTLIEWVAYIWISLPFGTLDTNVFRLQWKAKFKFTYWKNQTKLPLKLSLKINKSNSIVCERYLFIIKASQLVNKISEYNSWETTSWPTGINIRKQLKFEVKFSACRNIVVYTSHWPHRGTVHFLCVCFASSAECYKSRWPGNRFPLYECCRVCVLCLSDLSVCVVWMNEWMNVCMYVCMFK